MTRLLLIDLEETLIKVWNDFYPLEKNCAKIKKFNEVFQADEVRLCSWAVWNHKDVDVWDRVKEDFEIELGLKFDDGIQISEYIELVKQYTKLTQMDTGDFFDFYEKENFLFTLMTRGWMEGYHVVLFDDVVPSADIKLKNSRLTLINILHDDIEGWIHEIKS